MGAQLFHFFAVMLWAAGGLAFVAGMPQLGVAIFVIVVVNGLFAFLQEHRADRAAEALRDLLPRRATVVRDGRPVVVDAAELVMGDVVVLAAGDRLSADVDLDAARSLRLDLSTLTGESEPVAVGFGDHGFAGTFVVEGKGRGVVTATGAHTRLAGIAGLARQGRRPPSPLARELHRVVRKVAVIAVGVGTSFFAVAVLLGTPADDGFLFAIGVTVALVPEGLLPTVTLSLALGAQRMAAKHALVRRLDAVEALGATTFICTDKTGTLTRNEMAVVAAWTPVGAATVTGEGYDPAGSVVCETEAARAAIVDLAWSVRACSDGRVVEQGGRWVAHGDPMEAALDVFAARAGVTAEVEPRFRFPFDPRRRRMSVAVGDQLVVKGAPDAVLPRCVDGAAGAAAVVDDLTGRGFRVLAVAAAPAAGIGPDDIADCVETGLALLGLIALEDPPREHAAAAVAACRQMGVRVAMITGDHPGTAAAIARQVGLLLPGGFVVEGKDLPSDDDELGALLDADGVVVSRVSPEDKLRIARALRGRNHVVAMTGDGVNDGPALQAADVGVAMGRSGTDVAREAADLVLLDDDFATIVAAIEQGRATFANIKRFLTYHLTDNVAELTPFAVWALSGGSFPLAIGVLQVLCLDIGTDMLPALALGAEPPSVEDVARGPSRGALLDRPMMRRVFGVLGPVEAAVEMAAFTAGLLAAGWRPGLDMPTGPELYAASGAAFTAVVLGQMANAFACRSERVSPWRLGWRTNPLLVKAVAAELVMLAAFLFVGPLARTLGQSPPAVVPLAVAALAAPAVFAADMWHKRVRRGSSGPGPACAGGVQ